MSASQSGPESDGNEKVCHIPQSSSIRLFSVISRTYVWRGSYRGTVLPLWQRSSQYILQPHPTGQVIIVLVYLIAYQYESNDSFTPMVTQTYLTLFLEFCKEIYYHQICCIICLDYVQQISINLIKENWFHIKKKKQKQNKKQTISCKNNDRCRLCR